MATIWNYNSVKEYIENLGHELLSMEYINMKQKLKVRCPQGHITEKSFDSIKSTKGGCRVCTLQHRNSRKKTYTEVKEYIESFGYTLLSTEYIDAQSKLEICCPHKHQYMVSWNNFQSGKRCKKCNDLKNSRTRRISLDTVISEISKEGFKVVDAKDFQNSTSKIIVSCKNGHEYSTTWNRFQVGKRCPQCLKLDFNRVTSLIDDINYSLISSEGFKNSTSELTVCCDKGHIYTTNWAKLYSGQRCLECIKVPLDRVITYVEENGYKVVSSDNYDTSTSKILLSCDKGHIFKTSWNNFKNGRRCPQCNKKQLEDIINSIKSEDGYTVISTKGFKNARSKLLVKCNNGHEFKIHWSAFQSGQRCPKCRASRGEKEVSKVLSSMGIQYINQYRMDGCKYHGVLPFDFYIPNMNICIEYDGIQHYECVNFSGKMTEDEMNKNLKLVQKRDNIKNQYCSDNNIKLIRIPYWEFDNIEKILKEHIIL